MHWVFCNPKEAMVVLRFADTGRQHTEYDVPQTLATYPVN